MATPTLAKSWQFTYSGGHSTNVRMLASGVALTDYRTLMLLIKNILIGFSSTPWTVRCSSKGTGAGGTGTTGDGVDRWSTIADLVWAAAASNHSWFVLRQTGVGATFELCLDLSNASSANATIAISPSATFTGGTATARPTATDEMVLCSNTAWIDSGGASFTSVISVMMSTDGACTRLLCFKGGFPQAFWIIDAPATAVTGWSSPVFGGIKASSGASVLTYSNWLSGTPNGLVRISTTNGVAGMSTDNYSTGTTQIGNRGATQAMHDLAGEYLPHPCGIFVPTTAGARGRHGYFSDLWSVPLPASARAGEVFPNDTTRTFIQVGCFALPWNGEEPRVS